MPTPRKSTVGTRGKYAENKVKEYLNLLAEKMTFAFYRPPDAREGAKKEAPADFLTSDIRNYETKLTLIEVKEVAHDFRLPKKNFDKAQRARMRMWENTGAEGYVLVLHTTINQWRLIPLHAFEGDFSESGSWDLSGIPTTTLKDAMVKIYGERATS